MLSIMTNNNNGQQHMSKVLPIEAQYQLRVLQQPSRARACGIARSFAGRRTIDPPPVISIELRNEKSGGSNVVDRSIGHLIMRVTAQPVILQQQSDTNRPKSADIDPICGETTVGATIISSELRSGVLEDLNLKAFFVFSDLSIRYEGHYRLIFTLFEFPSGSSRLINRGSIKSETFRVYTAKEFPGLAPSTELDQMLKGLGSRIRIRKITGTKRGSSGSRKINKDGSVGAGMTPTGMNNSNSISRGSVSPVAVYSGPAASSQASTPMSASSNFSTASKTSIQHLLNEDQPVRLPSLSTELSPLVPSPYSQSPQMFDPYSRTSSPFSNSSTSPNSPAPVPFYLPPVSNYRPYFERRYSSEKKEDSGS